MTTHPATLMETDLSPADQTPAQASMVELAERLRAVRRRIARWLPSSEMLAFWSVDYAEICRSASRLQEAVRDLDDHMGDPTRLEDPACNLDLQLLLASVEARAEEFEESIVESVSPAQ
jgi:hypothetical protein